LGLWRRERDLGLWSLALNVLGVVVFVSASVFEDFYASFRVTTGVVVAFVIALPTLEALLPRGPAWFWLPTVLWMSAWWTLLPVAFQSQF
jgi:hypothetical protein